MNNNFGISVNILTQQLDVKEFIMQIVLVFQCCITSLAALKQHIDYLTVTVGQKSMHSVAEFSAQGLTESKLKVSPELQFSSRAWGLFPSSLVVGISCNCRTKALIFLLAVGRGRPSACRDRLPFLAVWPHG